MGALVDALLSDPALRQRIAADPALRQLWNHPDVRSRVAAAAEMAIAHEAMTLLARSLVSDATVQARIQADPGLRAMWADESVRRQILGTEDR